MERRWLLVVWSPFLGVCGVMLWSHMELRHPISFPRASFSLQVYIQDLDKAVWEDLKQCNDMYTEYNNTSHHYDVLMKRLRVIQEYIPANYSAEFRNPCWYDFHQKPTGSLMQTHKCVFSKRKNQTLVKHVLKQVKSPGEKHLYCLPTFFLSGFPKCATTSMYKMVIQHPLVAKTRCKEPMFWRRFASEVGRDLDKRIHPLWYLNMLSSSVESIESNPLSISLDATPTYTHSLHDNFCVLPTLLKRVLPEAKFILIMRNPSERYYSHYWFRNARLPFESKTKLSQYAHTAKALKDFHKRTVDAITYFQSCVDSGNSVMSCVINDRNSNISLHLHYSLYYYHISPWLKIFPRERFLFLRTEDLANDPSSTMSKVWHFLNLDNFPTERMFANVDSVIKDLAIPQDTKALLDEFYRPHNELLAQLLSDTRYLWND